MKEPIFALDPEHRFVIWNKSAEDITGLLAHNVIGKSILSVFDFSDDVSFETIECAESISALGTLNTRKFRVLIEPIDTERLVGCKGKLYLLDHGILKSLPTEYLVEVINASPISAIVFNLDGSILYSNNAYKELWNLSSEDLLFVNHKYNLFLDKQLAAQGLLPYIKRAFNGEVLKSDVFEYSFNSTSLGREGEIRTNQLMAHMYPIRDELGEVSFIVLNFIDVTENQKLQKAYIQSKERLQLALKGGSLGTWDWYLQTGEIIYNERWAEMLGYTLEEVYSITWEGLLHPEDRSGALIIQHEFEQGLHAEYESEFRLRSKSGKYRWILDRGKIVERDKTGLPIRAAGTHIDITERKRNEERIIESELKYRRLVENAPIGIAIIVDEKIAYINNELARIGEVDDPNHVYGASVKGFINGEDRYATFKEREAQVLTKNENAPLYSTQFKSVKGKVVDVEIVSIPIIYEGVQAIQVLIHDVTDRKLALKELSRSKELLNQLFDNSPMGIVFLNDKFKVRNINKGFEGIFGFSSEEIVGKSLIDFVVPSELKEEAIRLNESAMHGQIDYVESYRIDKSGTKKHLLIYTLPVMENNKHIGVYGIYIDIGQRVLAEEELKTRNLELDNFVYKVSHDLRAPLASILGLINLTKLEGADVDKEYYISLMEGQVNKLDYFIRDILSHSKNLKLSLSVDTIDFKEIVKKCFDDLGHMKAANTVVKKINIESSAFVSDKWRINEIFRNLISNAIKYRNTDLDENIVEVNIKMGKDFCDIIVADNGIGIPKEKLPHVMEMFYRGTETSDGSGIGLYIVQKAVEKLNGTISIESKPNEGTKFMIHLPALSKEI